MATGEARTTGVVERSTVDSLRLTLRDGQTARFSWANIEDTEYSMGKQGQARRGAFIGAGIMTALTIGSVVFDNSGDEGEEDLSAIAVIVALPGNMLIGAGVGALIGLAWRTERWSVLPVGSASVERGFRPGITVSARL